MKALVTGACGFVGRYLVDELVSFNWDVAATDILDAPPPAGVTIPGEGTRTLPPPAASGGSSYRRCDLTDPVSAAALVEETSPDAVFHLAAQSSAGRSFDDPFGTIRTNLFGTLGLLEALRRSPRGRKTVFLSVSSSEEYGRRPREEMPLREESRIEPVSPYAVSKAAQGMLALQYGTCHGLPVIVTRSFGHTGPGQSDMFVLPAFARRCARVRLGLDEPVVRTGNIDVERDFLDVRDVVRAYRLLVESGSRGRVFNVCSGTGLQLRDALDILLARIPGDVQVETDPALLRPVDVPVMIGSNERLRAAIDWEPSIGRGRMLADLADWWERREAADG
ncbi:MAG: GDP-mannose 4,6-dehydratase [Candidatus Krumholzibacteriota bacterium]|nr:GDP-mannose 4,6-dehydratase [Candidatus Krumholzibacteriota bacterium]